jgi:hypothetical protein
VVADWSGETQPFVPLFISPGRSAETAAKAAAPKSEKRARGSNNTVEYSMILSGTQRRPKTRMPIEGHKAVGRLLKSVLVGTRQRAGVYGRVDAIRYELDNWVQCEYKRDELSDEIFHDLYYRELPKDDPLATPLSSRDRHIATLAEVEARLARYYPECPPLRALLKKADLAIASLRAWN